MKPTQRRDRLFKASRPNVREMSLIDQQGYTKDMGILWGAYKQGSFDLPEVTQEDFAQLILNEINPYEKKWIIEDKNNKFESGYGAIGMMCAVYNGWELEPHFEPFSWSTPRNTLRAVVSFLQMMKYDREVGIVNVYALEDVHGFYNHIVDYGVLRFATKIPHGDIRGDRYVYYIRGKKNVRNSN